MARRLVAALETAPPYAVARIADSLERLVVALAGDAPDPAEQVARSLAWLKDE